MKRMGLLVGLLLLTVSIMAQQEKIKQKFIEETRVEAPVFEGHEMITDMNEFMVEELSFLSKVDANGVEGIVSVQFTIEPDGSVVNPHVINSVSNMLDNAVLNAVKKSDKMWMAGKVNGEAITMDKTIYVKFDIPGNESHEKLARENLKLAVKRICMIESIEKDLFITEYKKDKKVNRKAKLAESFLCRAEKYSPDELSILFWQARLFELKGDMDRMNEKLNQYEELADANRFEEYLLNTNQLAIVQL
nr:energy transducer TonB [uncultured Carboxylicivirga sp.]